MFETLPLIACLNLKTENLYSEIALIAYHFHWSKQSCLAMSWQERKRWLEEIVKINQAVHRQHTK